MNNTKKKVAFHTLGCKLNFAETSAISRSFPEDRFDKVPASEEADVYIINTCSVTDAADRKCRQAIRKFINRSPDAFIAVVGCYAQMKPQEVSSIPGVDMVLGTNEKFDIARYLDITSKREKAEIHSAGLAGKVDFYPSFSFGDRTRSFLKVQDGCDYGCSYCTVPLARGQSRNQAVPEIVAEAEEIARRGIKEVVLTGVNIGDFGKSTGESFLDLLRELVRVPGLERFRISSVEPNLLTDEIIELTAESGKILPHFHIPLQSGSNKILGLMRRRYKRELFAGKIGMISGKMPHAGIGADIIVGFPGETDADFEETYAFLADMPLSYLHVFNFSERPGTHAAQLSGKVPSAVRDLRSKTLISLSEKKHLEFCKMNIGRISDVLFEHARDKGMITGFTGNYIKTEHPWENRLAGAIARVVLRDVAPSGRMTAELKE
jgi:threonylcarbamoyladenosine tRNA methylthiotransferase MtaB